MSAEGQRGRGFGSLSASRHRLARPGLPHARTGRPLRVVSIQIHVQSSPCAILAIGPETIASVQSIRKVSRRESHASELFEICSNLSATILTRDRRNCPNCLNESGHARVALGLPAGGAVWVE